MKNNGLQVPLKPALKGGSTRSQARQEFRESLEFFHGTIDTL